MSSDNEYEVINSANSYEDEDLLDYSDSDLHLETESESDNRTMPENITEKCKKITSELYNEIYAMVVEDLLLGDNSDIESYKKQLEQAKQKILKLTLERDESNKNSMKLSLEIDTLVEEIKDLSDYIEKTHKLEEKNRSLNEQLYHEKELNKHISIDTKKLQSYIKQIEMLQLEVEAKFLLNEQLKSKTNDYHDLGNKLNELVIENDGLKTKNKELFNELYSSEYKSKTEYNTMKNGLNTRNRLAKKLKERDLKSKLKLESNDQLVILANSNLNTLANACELVKMTNWSDSKEINDNCIDKFDETTKEYAINGYGHYKNLDYKHIDINDINRSSCGIDGWAKYYEEVLEYESKLSSNVSSKRYNLRPRK